MKTEHMEDPRELILAPPELKDESDGLRDRFEYRPALGRLPPPFPVPDDDEVDYEVPTFLRRPTRPPRPTYRDVRIPTGPPVLQPGEWERPGPVTKEAEDVDESGKPKKWVPKLTSLPEDPNTTTWVSPFAEKEDDTEKDKIKWTPELIRMVAKDVGKNVLKNYDPIHATNWERLTMAGGLAVNLAILNADLAAPGVKTAISVGLTAVTQLASSKMHYDRELEIIKNFHGDDMNQRLKALRKEHATSEAKLRLALGRFSAGGVIANAGFHGLGQQIAESVQHVSALQHDLSAIPLQEKLADVKGPDALLSKLPKPDVDLSNLPKPNIDTSKLSDAGGFVSKTLSKIKLPFFSHDSSSVSAPLITHPTLGEPVPFPEVHEVSEPGLLAGTPDSPDIPESPAPTLPLPSVAPTLDAQPTADIPPAPKPVFHDGASIADDLKVVTHNGSISDQDFLQVLARHPDDLQKNVSGSVGANLNLTEKFAREAAELQGIDPASLPADRLSEVEMVARHKLESFANKVYADQLAAAANSGDLDQAHLDEALKSAAKTYDQTVQSQRVQNIFTNLTSGDVFNGSQHSIDIIQSSDQIQPFISAEVQQHMGVTKHVVDQVIQDQGISPSLVSPDQYQDLTAAVQHTMEAEANRVYGDEIYKLILDSNITVDHVLTSGSHTFDVVITSGAGHDHLVDIAKQTLESQLQQHDQITTALTQEFLNDPLKEITIPEHTDVSHILQDHDYQIGWVPGDPNYIQTVNVFEAEIAVNYDGFAAYFKELADRGWLGDDPHIAASLGDIHNLAVEARRGDMSAMKKMIDILNKLKAGAMLKVVTPDQIDRVQSVLRAYSK